jgi:hypothetical protein
LLAGGITRDGFRRFRGGMAAEFRGHFDTACIAAASAQCELQFLPAAHYI